MTWLTIMLSLFLNIPTHKVADWFMAQSRHMFDMMGLEKYPDLEEWLYILLAGIVAVTIGWVMRKVILWTVQKVVELRHTTEGPEMLKSKLFTKCSHVIPPLVMLSLVPLALDYGTMMREVIDKLLLIYAVLAFADAICSVIEFTWIRYDLHLNTRNLPLRGIVSMMKGIVWSVAVIIIVSLILDKSPAALLTGLGAFAAALMLIFKDSLLGLVASVQITQNDMVRIGDWITVPDTPVNGVVYDMTLSTVKVRNFDNTIATCPPYKLVQSSFQNWRGMHQSGARRMLYDMVIPNECVKPATQELIDAVAAKTPTLKKWIDTVSQSPEKAIYAAGGMVMNGSIATNLGLFRAFVCDMLINHPHVDKKQLMIVRVMPPTEGGTLLNIYFFTNTSVWVVYQAITSDIMERIIAAAPEFGLKIYTPVMGDVTTDVPPEAASK